MIIAALLFLSVSAWIGQSNATFFVGTTPKNWHAAYMSCRQNGLRLAVIDTAQKQSLAEQLIIQIGAQGQSFWIAGTNLNSNSAYSWMSNGRPIQYSNWDALQPDNYLGIEHCIHIWHTLKWNDIPCANQYYYICEDTCCEC